jgi:hypothetical protein
MRYYASMSDTPSSSKPAIPAELHWTWRAVLTGLGAFSVLLSVALYDNPPVRESVDATGSNAQVRRTQPADPTAFSISLLVFGGIALVLAANGRKILRLSKEGADFDGHSPSEVTKDDKNAQKAIEKADKEPPVTPVTPSTTFVKDGYEYQTYELDGIPPEVIADIQQEQPDVIKSFADILYGFRRTGQGNPSWFVKLRTGTTLQVSYGGRGKTGSTVKKVEE